jgi:hypothetical protein
MKGSRDPGFKGSIRLLKNAHLLRFPHPSSLRRTSKYASLLRTSGAFHLGIFEQPAGNEFFSNLSVKCLIVSGRYILAEDILIILAELIFSLRQKRLNP